MSVIYKPGAGWSDVCSVPGGFAFVWALPGAVAFQTPTAQYEIPVPTDHLRYLRAAGSPLGAVAAIGVGADDIAYLVTVAGAVRWGVAKGQNAVGLYWGDDWVPVIQRTSESYSVGQEWRAFPPHIKGTSQGFRDVRPDGSIVFGDDAHFVDDGGVRLHKPCTRGGVVVGQIDGTDHIQGVGPVGRFHAIDGPAYEPHVAQNSDQYAICARTGQGAAFLVVPPFPVIITPPDVTPPDPEPIPNPGPIEPNPGTPMLTKDYSGLVREQWNVQNMDARQIAAFKAGGKPAIQLLQGHFTRSIARMARGGQGDTGVWMEFYHNPIPGTNAQIEPAVLLIDDGGKTWSAKIIRGYDQGGRFAPEGVKNPDGSDVERWTFGEVDWNVSDVMPNPADRRDPFAVELPPLTWETQQPAPTPDPTPEPEPAPPPANLEQRVRELESEVAALSTAIDAQRHELQQVYDVLQALDLDNVIKKGHPVDVRGTISVPFFGSLPISAKGTL